MMSALCECIAREFIHDSPELPADEPQEHIRRLRENDSTLTELKIKGFSYAAELAICDALAANMGLHMLSIYDRDTAEALSLAQ